MGLLDKMKNLFTDEIDEEPIKSEKISVEIPAPAKVEEKMISDSEVIKTEEKVAAPIFFDDAYFKELEQPKKEVKSSYLKPEPIKVEKKLFHPTPIISPVYGVLDKNYNKEDIFDKKTQVSLYSTNTKITIDEVRKKAYGTLEDELETTLFGNNSILFSDIPEEKNNDEDLFEELTEDNDTDNILENKEFSLEDDLMETEEINIVEEEMDKPDSPVSESELFDLIDSMYEKGE